MDCAFLKKRVKKMQTNYATGRFVTKILKFIGWTIVIIGLLVFLSGLVSIGGSYNYGVGGIGGAIYGITLAFSGLISVMLSQLAEAIFDMADGSNFKPTNQPSAAPYAGATRHQTNRTPLSSINTLGAGDVIKTYNGHAIIKQENGVSVGGKPFSGILKAEAYINGL
jgi:hypothetical protein